MQRGIQSGQTEDNEEIENTKEKTTDKKDESAPPFPEKDPTTPRGEHELNDDPIVDDDAHVIDIKEEDGDDFVAPPRGSEMDDEGSPLAFSLEGKVWEKGSLHLNLTKLVPQPASGASRYSRGDGSTTPYLLGMGTPDPSHAGHGDRRFAKKEEVKTWWNRAVETYKKWGPWSFKQSLDFSRAGLPVFFILYLILGLLPNTVTYPLAGIVYLGSFAFSSALEKGITWVVTPHHQNWREFIASTPRSLIRKLGSLSLVSALGAGGGLLISFLPGNEGALLILNNSLIILPPAGIAGYFIYKGLDEVVLERVLKRWLCWPAKEKIIEIEQDQPNLKQQTWYFVRKQICAAGGADFGSFCLGYGGPQVEVAKYVGTLLALDAVERVSRPASEEEQERYVSLESSSEDESSTATTSTQSTTRSRMASIQNWWLLLNLLQFIFQRVLPAGAGMGIVTLPQAFDSSVLSDRPVTDGKIIALIMFTLFLSGALAWKLSAYYCVTTFKRKNTDDNSTPEASTSPVVSGFSSSSRDATPHDGSPNLSGDEEEKEKGKEKEKEKEEDKLPNESSPLIMAGP